MENKNNTSDPKNKKILNDWMKMIIGIIGVIFFLVALKYLMDVLGLM